MIDLRGLSKWKLIVMVAAAATIVCTACAIAVLIFTLALLDKDAKAAVTATAEARQTQAAAQTRTARPTAPPTPTVLPTASVPANTPAPAPGATATTSAATATGTYSSAARIFVMTVNRRDEYVDIVNAGDAPQDLTGWLLVSEEGGQQCPLSGVLEPGKTLRIWALAGDLSRGGLSCGFQTEIWNNDGADAAVLLDAAGREVSRK